MGMGADMYDPNNSVFEAETDGHYNNMPNALINNATSPNTNNSVVMMQMTPLPQMGGQFDNSYPASATRAEFDEDEHQRQLMLRQQVMADHPPAMHRPKSSMSGHQSRGVFSLFSYLVKLQILSNAYLFNLLCNCGNERIKMHLLGRNGKDYQRTKISNKYWCAIKMCVVVTS